MCVIMVLGWDHQWRTRTHTPFVDLQTTDSMGVKFIPSEHNITDILATGSGFGQLFNCFFFLSELNPSYTAVFSGSIPVKESIEVCEERLKQDSTLADRTSMDVETIISLLRFCLTSTSFQYGGKHFKQVDGVAMGSPVSSVIADIFMENLEMKAFQGYGTVPRVWKRFVDDVLAVVRKAEVERFLDHLNSTHPNILFTMELEQNRSLPFMDVRFTRLPSGALEREVYCKPTHTNRYIHADSYQPMNVKSATIRCLVDRAFNVVQMPFVSENKRQYERSGGERIQKKICKQGYQTTNSPK